MEERPTVRQLPAVHRVLAEPVLPREPRDLVRRLVGEELGRLRARLRAGEPVGPGELSPSEVARRVAERLQGHLRPSLRRVLNLTGVPLHTNLGRAVLAEEAREAVVRVLSGYQNLEYDVAEGRRGSRHDHVQGILRELTGAEAALVVNNNAAAVLVVLSALAAGKEVVVSRGELVEIGGSFRVPDVMAQSGARLVEVGTTNKTHLADYERAIGPETALLLRVHQSNFRQIGFTARVPLEELTALAHRRGLPVMEDLGSGVLVRLSTRGLPEEPSVQEVLAAGVDVVTFSGDKLLGGPQAGLIVGRAELVDRVRRHPLLRAVRIDKMTLAALEATLHLYRDPEQAFARIPTLAMLVAEPRRIRARAQAIARALRARQVPCRVVPEVSVVGGGALPGAELPTFVVQVEAPSAARLERALREEEPPVVARVEGGRVLLDPRTLLSGEERLLVEAVARAHARAAAERG